MKRGRPKGRSSDTRSFGPLGDLIRKNRMLRGLGLSEVASACGCSVQFVSNIEHGRAPLPWEKVTLLAAVLKIPAEDIQAANLSIRSDFKSFMNGSANKNVGRPSKKMVLQVGKLPGAASVMALAAKDAQLREVIQRYQNASNDTRKKFLKAALQTLN